MKATHTGMIRRCSSACMGKDHVEKLRELKRYYVTEYGNKYSKLSGWCINSRFPLWSLDIQSVKPI